MSRERRPAVQRRGSGRIRRDVTADDFDFTEETPLEQGFAHVFRDRIVPVLRRQETQRREMRGKAMMWIAASARIAWRLFSWRRRIGTIRSR